MHDLVRPPDPVFEIPVAEVYRGCEIFDLQPPERIAKAKAEIDEVHATASPLRLYKLAIDASRSPESRLLAKNKAIAATAERQRRSFDVAVLEAKCIGIERAATRLGRLMGRRSAGWWPDSWRPPE